MINKKPFWLSRQRCGFIFLFENIKDFELIAFDDEVQTDFAESAKNLIDNMDDHWCVAFLEALRDECTKRIKENHKWVKKALKELK